ncbi:uncharacterized protein LOC133805887 [Humulus lupulus]|uniref:uncharacterized protein LOC133805887 n=1 Tax=Humulus lupulus TaxID=3486 RepID=UPI002B4074D3|nr:uncharacterized protein LOC133805887 [Humulus lupulus]
MDAWTCLHDLFQDNEHSRAVTLEHEFSSTHMRDFPNVSAYCQRLKILADQLKNVGTPVSNSRLVLQLVAGLTDAYSGVGMLIRRSKPLPPFYQARSMLTLEEADFAKKVANEIDSAMFSSASDDATSYPDTKPQNHGDGNKHNTKNKNRNNNGHKVKYDGSFERHKARLVGDGAGQQVGIDCGDTFSPVVKPVTIRSMLSLSLSKAWPIH